MNVEFCLRGDARDYPTLRAMLRAATVGARWVDHRLLQRLQLGLHELVVNIYRHAHDQGPRPVRLVVTADQDAVAIEVRDGGRPFEGTLAASLPGVSAGGGYGVPIIAAVFGTVRYERIDSENRWLLVLGRSGS